MRALRLVGLTLAALLGLSAFAQAATLSTPRIVAETARAIPACLHWRPIGTCFWLRCNLGGCSVRTSLKVGHYRPDLVVSVYNVLGQNPWTAIRGTLGQAQRAAATGLLGRLLPVPVDSAGNRTEGSFGHRDHKNLLFRETDAIGHPLGALADVVDEVGLLCPSETTAFVPYFQSALDALAWREAVPESFYPASLIPGLREIGTWPLQTWGSVHPRTGWTTQAEEPKAAAINAQRAGDIVTRRDQPHVYRPVVETDASSLKIWSPGPLREKDPATGTWQMLLPEPEHSCAVFGVDDRASLTGWGGGKVDPEGDYVWNLWRPYQCCPRRGQFFLFSVDWATFPP
jgi:integrating conjugative element protein (TIGR03756 family)